MKINDIQSDLACVSHATSNLPLDTFEAWWHLPIAWLEPPNLERGGWSGVGRWEIAAGNANTCVVYVKRQQNHTRFSWRYPLSGEPTFMVECRMLATLKQHGVHVPELVFFGARDTSDGRQAVLVTKALDGFHPFSEDCSPDAMVANIPLLLAVSQAIQRLHQVGIQHRALYPKHIFIREHNGVFEVALIDLEKAKHMWFPAIQRFHDLKQFLRRVADWPEKLRYQFYQVYCGNMHPVLMQMGWWWLQRDLNRLNKR